MTSQDSYEMRFDNSVTDESHMITFEFEALHGRAPFDVVPRQFELIEGEKDQKPDWSKASLYIPEGNYDYPETDPEDYSESDCA